MNRERPGWYQSSGESDDAESNAAQREKQESAARAPSWRRRDKYDPFERLRRRRVQAEAEKAERVQRAERAAAEDEARRSRSGSAPAVNPFADQPLAGPWGDGAAQETIAGDYPVIVNDPEHPEAGRSEDEGKRAKE